eukprot:1144052-Pelagomonas_calceolata.AAC.5
MNLHFWVVARTAAAAAENSEEQQGSLQWQQRGSTEREAVERVAGMKNGGWKQGAISMEHWLRSEG